WDLRGPWPGRVAPWRRDPDRRGRQGRGREVHPERPAGPPDGPPGPSRGGCRRRRATEPGRDARAGPRGDGLDRPRRRGCRLHRGEDRGQAGRGGGRDAPAEPRHFGPGGPAFRGGARRGPPGGDGRCAAGRRWMPVPRDRPGRRGRGRDAPAGGRRGGDGHPCRRRALRTRTGSRLRHRHRGGRTDLQCRTGRGGLGPHGSRARDRHAPPGDQPLEVRRRRRAGTGLRRPARWVHVLLGDHPLLRRRRARVRTGGRPPAGRLFARRGHGRVGRRRPGARPAPGRIGGLMRAVVIGTGPAGITAAETLRLQDPNGSVVALSTEPYPPYSPAAMADHFLTGRDETLYWKGANAAERMGIEERREAVVVGVDVDNYEVVLHDDSRIPYEGLIIASGSRLHAPLEGADLPGVLDFKSMRMADELIGRVKRGEVRTALIVGNGFIGVELSLLLAGLGVDVTIIGRRPWIMPRVLDAVTAAVAERGLI